MSYKYFFRCLIRVDSKVNKIRPELLDIKNTAALQMFQRTSTQDVLLLIEDTDTLSGTVATAFFLSHILMNCSKRETSPPMKESKDKTQKDVTARMESVSIKIPYTHGRRVERDPLPIFELHKLDKHAWDSTKDVLGRWAAGLGVGPATDDSNEWIEPSSPPRPYRPTWAL